MTPQHRYEVGWLADDGAFDTYDWVRTISAARITAQRIYGREGHRSQQTFIFDRMARFGYPELWTYDGEVLAIARVRTHDNSAV